MNHNEHKKTLLAIFNQNAKRIQDLECKLRKLEEELEEEKRKVRNLKTALECANQELEEEKKKSRLFRNGLEIERMPK